MPSRSSQASQQTYRAHAGDSLLSEVSRVIMVLLPHGMLLAGLHEMGHIMMVRWIGGNPSSPEWDTSFLEQLIGSEALLGKPDAVRTIFIADQRSLLVPDALYEPYASQDWLKKLYWVSPQEHIVEHAMEKSELHALFVLPDAVQDLLTNSFSKARILPANAAHLAKIAQAEVLIQCTLMSGMAMATLHKGGYLLWHQSFQFENAEDIAYQIAAACKHASIERNDALFLANAANLGGGATLTALKEYFPRLKFAGNVISHDPDWVPVLSFLLQLQACAS